MGLFAILDDTDSVKITDRLGDIAVEVCRVQTEHNAIFNAHRFSLMTASIVYYSKSFTPWKEPLTELLTQETPFSYELQAFEHLIECPVAAYVLVCEHDLQAQDLALLGARKVLILLDQWNLGRSLKWVMQGVNDSAAVDDLARVANWIIAEQHRSAWNPVLPEQQQGILQTVLDAIPVPIFYKDELHVYRGCNRAFSEFLGIDVEKIVGHSVYDIAPKELADIYHEADCALLADGGTQVYEASVKSAAGRQYEIEFNKAVFYKRNGDKGGQVGAMLDITERNRLMKKLDQASRTDPLTGVGNRREFNLNVSIELQKAEKVRGSTSLLTIDIDHFKSINDAYGHTCGDDALKFLVQCIYEAIPEKASVYRIGGEEFYVLIPNTDLAMARKVAENVRSHIPEQTLTLKGELVSMTVSIGAIQLASEHQLEESFKRVDQALYEAKMTGRNRVCLAYYD